MRSTSNPPDLALMRSFGNGDRSAGERLYDRYASRIYGLGLVMLGNEAAAEDLVQDSFVKLLRSAERYDPARRRWTALPGMRTPRHGLGGAAQGRRVYALEGGVRPGFSFSSALEALDVG